MTLLAINETFLWIGWFLFVVLFGLVAINVVKLPKFNLFKKEATPTPVENFDVAAIEKDPEDLPKEVVIEQEKPAKKMDKMKAKPGRKRKEVK